MVEKYRPDVYQKSIYYINFDKLYKKGIRCLLFDLDNTLVPCDVKEPTKRLKKFFDELKDKGFKIIIMSNSAKRRLEPFKNQLNVDVCAFALKPKSDKYIKILEKFKYKPQQVAAIGDQLLTDIKGANKMDITSILVNPLTSKDFTISTFNRMLEKIIFNSLEKQDVFERGKYYD